MFEKLACRLARSYAKLKYWLSLWHVGMFIGTLACKNEKLAHFWDVDMQAFDLANSSPSQLRATFHSSN